MTIESHYKELLTHIEGLDYSDTKAALVYASKELYKQSSDLCLLTMINALIKAPDFLPEKLTEIVNTYVYYEGTMGIYRYIKTKLQENESNPSFYYADVFEYLLEALEEKYQKMGVDLKKVIEG